jgi:hypothetical protein
VVLAGQVKMGLGIAVNPLTTVVNHLILGEHLVEGAENGDIVEAAGNQ